MPWINKAMCTGCGVCLKECPVGAIEQQANGLAEINEDECIRCGRCHEVCPREAVRHDSERIPQEVANNLRWVRQLLGHFDSSEEQAAFIKRITRFFKKQDKVIEQTLNAIHSLTDNRIEDINAAIETLSLSRHVESSKE